MCEQLTSCGVKVTEPFGLAIHTINSHSTTWTALKLERKPNRCEYREMEWREGREQPDIRWRAEDTEDTRHAVETWVNKRFPKRIDLVNHCILNAEYVDASGCTCLAKLDAPVAKTVNASGCTCLAKLDAPKAEYVDARDCTVLAKLDAPVAKTVNASGCTVLAKLDAPKAEYVDARDCTVLAKDSSSVPAASRAVQPKKSAAMNEQPVTLRRGLSDGGENAKRRGGPDYYRALRAKGIAKAKLRAIAERNAK